MEYTIELARVRVLRGGEALSMQPRALEVALALGAQGGRLRASALADMIYPEQDGATATDRLRINVHRLRAQAPGLLALTRDGMYALNDAVVVDLDSYEALDNTFDAVLVSRALTALADVNARSAARWDWFESVEGRINGVRSDISQLCATRPLSEPVAKAVLAAARATLLRDPCDEIACKLAVRALLATGRRTEAIRALKAYEHAIRSEYAVEPSSEIRRLAELAV